jgi:hypothetical protein
LYGVFDEREAIRAQADEPPVSKRCAGTVHSIKASRIALLKSPIAGGKGFLAPVVKLC